MSDCYEVLSEQTISDLEKIFFRKSSDSLDIDRVAWLRAAISSCAYAEKHMRNALRCASQNDLLTHCLAVAPQDGLVLEFGVHTGSTISHIGLSRPHQTVYGFDSFEGLPEDWRPGFPKGAFALGRLPSVPTNVKLIKGWFSDTLPPFAVVHTGQTISLLHVDCDLYSSTVTIFSELKDMIMPGTIILFDEFFNYPYWEMHEVKAFEEFCISNGVVCEFIGLVAHHQQVAVRVLGRTAHLSTSGVSPQALDAEGFES